MLLTSVQNRAVTGRLHRQREMHMQVNTEWRKPCPSPEQDPLPAAATGAEQGGAVVVLWLLSRCLAGSSLALKKYHKLELRGGPVWFVSQAQIFSRYIADAITASKRSQPFFSTNFKLLCFKIKIIVIFGKQPVSQWSSSSCLAKNDDNSATKQQTKIQDYSEIRKIY